MTKIIKSIIKINTDDWKHDKTTNGNNRYTAYMDNYTKDHVCFDSCLVYIGNHPPDIESNSQYIAHLQQKNGYYLLVNSTEKTGPLYFEKKTNAKTVDDVTVFEEKQLTDKEERYVGELMNIDGVGEKTARMLVRNDIKTVADITKLGINELTKYDGIGNKTAETIMKAVEDAELPDANDIMQKFRDKVTNPPEVPYNKKINFDLFDTDELSNKILTSVDKGAKNSMDYKVKGRTLRSSQMGKDHAYIFLDTYYHELPTAWKQSVMRIEAEHLDGNLGNTTPGTAAHEYFQLAMEAVAKEYQEVQLLSHELPLIADYGDFRSKGHYDGLLRVMDNNGDYQLMVMDIKTKGGKWYDIMVNNFEMKKQQWQRHLQRVADKTVEYDPEELASGILDFTILDPYHIVQLHDYMNKLGVKHSIIVYVSKKDYSVYVVYVPFVQAIVDFMMDWGRKAIEYRKQLNVIPPAIYDVEGGEYEHHKTGDRLSNKQKDMLDYPCRKADKRNILKYQCKFIRICYDRKRLGKYNTEMEVIE